MTISKTKLKEKIRRKSNPKLVALIHFLKNQSPFWMKVAEYLAKPKRRAIKVNIERINKIAKPNSVVIVPGKVLSEGEMSKSIIIAAFSFSENAKKKLAKSKIVLIEHLAKENKKGDNIQLII
jgi:large subunit ribosomal protein L18e